MNESVEDERERRARELRLAELATSQHGVVAARQLRELGLSRQAIGYRVSIGRLHPLHRGVYAVGDRALPSLGRHLGAVLACGAGAVLSHRSAAAVWGLREDSRVTRDVTVRCGRRRRAIEVHRTRLHEDDRDEVARVPVTSVARTLLDLAATLRGAQAERAFEQAERLRLLDLRAVRALLERSQGRVGAPALRAIVEGAHPGGAATRSELEARFLDLCRDHGLPAPMVNSWVQGMEVDAVWHDRRLVVELDGFAYHRTAAAAHRDRARDRRLTLAGYRVMRFGWHEVAREPEAAVSALRPILGRDPRAR